MMLLSRYMRRSENLSRDLPIVFYGFGQVNRVRVSSLLGCEKGNL